MAELEIINIKEEMDRLEEIIRKNISGFYEVGRALLEIRDKKLYRDVYNFNTLEEYCKNKWEFSPRNAYYLINAYEVVENVKSSSQIPTRINHTYSLSRLTPEQQRIVWDETVNTAPEGKITASLVSKITKRMFPMPKKENKIDVKPQFPSDAMLYSGIALSQLKRIHPDDPKRNEAFDMITKWITNERKK